jgi:hypothetical protein
MERDNHVPASLSEEEVEWVRMKIKQEMKKDKLRDAIIEKSLSSLVWSGLVFIGYALWNYILEHSKR